MKAILMSIQPKWVTMIEYRKKTIEVRKTRPKIETPFKCYIYCTFPQKPVYDIWINRGTENRFLGNGKVVAEFVCDRIDEYTSGIPPFYEALDGYNVYPPELEKMCLGYKDLDAYGKGNPLYAWHISALKIYDQPKELGEFRTLCKTYRFSDDRKCWNCPNLQLSEGTKEAWQGDCLSKYKPLTRPPQSWCYVEELED